MKIVVFNLGCKVNKYESDSIARALREKGHDVVCELEKADVYILNTCAVTNEAERKSRQCVTRCLKLNPSAKVIVAGCASQANGAQFEKKKGVTFISGVAGKRNIVDELDKAGVFIEPLPTVYEDMETPSVERTRAYVKVQDGCDNCCSYCVIPQARGRPRSRSFGEIIEDAKNLAARGAREITLTGINITKFSTPDGGLVELVDALDKIGGLSRIRIGSIEPQDMPVDALLERAADDSHKLQPHFHVCAQSLCGRVLKAMRRKNTAAEFLEFVRKAKDKCADISIGADIICGRPFERDCDYLETKAAMLSSGLSYAHVFTFSPRPKTLAATMGADTPPPRVRRMRSDDLRAAAAQMHERFMASQLGKVRPILFEKPIEGGKYLAYTDNYIRLEVCGASSGLKNTMALARLESIIDSSRVSASAVRCGK